MNHMSKISHSVLRRWQNSNSRLTSDDFILPLFISEDEDSKEPIPSMPDMLRIGVNELYEYILPLSKIGLKSVLLFGVLNSDCSKDETGAPADDQVGPVVKAIILLKEQFPQLLICCDVCLCEYTSHGHCGILNSDGTINNAASIRRISEVACTYAKAGAHVVAPSDMMDNRIGAIKTALKLMGDNKTCIMSYSSKFSSSMYGPFRDACKSGPQFGDRKTYQLPLGSSQLGQLTTERDIEEGADIVMVKPGMFYLDVVNAIKSRHPNHLLAVYQVSGDYVMVHDYATKSGNFKSIVCESLFSMKRAGADVIISYFTPVVLKWLHENGGILTP
ncbi:delta-aminolevulinic acid dehydratase-like [Bolinopsis microptera]|uniref:delta-aminolevulinic acid dehydratase-like n=1 Tax=Bolinopsis microptera TaxID=2820187 RepID=UPI00307A6D17